VNKVTYETASSAVRQLILAIRLARWGCQGRSSGTFTTTHINCQQY